MQYELKFTCKDSFGEWPSKLCIFAENDIHAKNLAKDGLKHIRQMFADINLFNIKLFENVLQETNDYSIIFKDRFVCDMN